MVPAVYLESYPGSTQETAEGMSNDDEFLFPENLAYSLNIRNLSANTERLER